MKLDRRAAGRVIRSLRRSRKLSQDVLSGLAGIARTHLSMIETGSKQPNFETLWKLSGALDIRPSELVGLIELECEKAEADERGYEGA